ncbi:MAG: DUF1800 domain-containing protein [Phycisphaeraceae bacterium]|nr:DUF1800 domain-containing protein [Phycisphaeraceae bacterium]
MSRFSRSNLGVIGGGPGDDLLAALVSRCTFGVTEAEMSLARSLGYWGYLEYQLAWDMIDDTACENFVQASYPAIKMSPNQLLTLTGGDATNQLRRARIYRAVKSKRQLLEVMVEMWTDHFNIYNGSAPTDSMKVVDDRSVIRPNALGSFPALLWASAHSPAMLEYLNNDTNSRTAPNENYARELMELHTLGVNGGYTQADVLAVARCFTGWRYVTGGATTPNVHTFLYNTGTHDVNSKTLSPIFDIAGGYQNPVVIPARTAAAGIQDAIDVLNILSVHPNTAAYIAGKILTHLWGQNPPQSLVSALAQVYLATGGDIKQMVRWTLDPARISSAPWKFKRPLHLAASALRATSATITQTNSVQTAIGAAGHMPFAWLTPDGYPDKVEAWVDLLLPRWSFGASLMNNEYWNSTTQLGSTVDSVPLMAGAVSPASVLKQINKVIFGGKMPPQDLAGLSQYIGVSNPSNTKIRESIGLAIGCPAFQWY